MPRIGQKTKKPTEAAVKNLLNKGLVGAATQAAVAGKVEVSSKPGDSTRQYLKEYGYEDGFIDAYFQKCEAALQAGLDKAQKPGELEGDPIEHGDLKTLLWVEKRAAVVDGRDQNFITSENVREVAKQRMAGKTKKTVKTADGKTEQVVKVVKPVENSFGVDLTQTESGKYLFFGTPVTGIFRWMGADGWTAEQAMEALKNLGIGEDEVSISTARIQVSAGKKGGDCGGRGPVPSLTMEQADALRSAGGQATSVRSTAKKAAKKSPKPKK
jgi:hypothetical protein